MVALQNESVRVLVAGRSPAWCAGIARFLEVPPLAPVAAFTVDAALERAVEAPPALAVVDRHLADAPGAELAGELRRRHPGVRVLLAVEDEGADAQLEALAAGACGWLLPTWTREAVLDAAHDALRGLTRFDPAALSPLADLARRAPGREERLTEQERVVLRLMRQHLTYKEIALRLGLSWHTVRSHAQSILRKCGVHSRRDLLRWDARADAAPPPVGRERVA